MMTRTRKGLGLDWRVRPLETPVSALLRLRRFPLALLLMAPPAVAVAAPIPGSGEAVDITLMLVYLGLAIGLSFLCSIAESVLLSITPSFIAGLQARGYSDADIRKILGGNFLRVWAQIEAGAER